MTYDGNFVAIDFETADNGRDSACALAMVRVEDNQIVDRYYTLIRPPRSKFIHTGIHGISWSDVDEEADFKGVWLEAKKKIEGVPFLVAHNAAFDRSVLAKCCEMAGAKSPQLDFLCTVQLARQVWNIHPTKLSDVCRHLDIPLKHHHAASDAEACAQIVLRARGCH